MDMGWDIGQWDAYGMGSGYGVDLEWIRDHRTIELLRLEKSSKVIRSNRNPT